MNSDAENTEAEIVVTATRHLERYSLEEACEVSGLEIERILEVTRADVVPGIAGSDEAPEFDLRAIGRLRQLAALMEGQGIGLETVHTIARLIDRLERAEDELRYWRERHRTT